MAFNFNLPSITESYANLASFPATGRTVVLYKALDTTNLYTWSGTAYVLVDKRFASSWGSVSQAPESTSITKDQVGLGNVDNTSDVNKPISTAIQTALNLKVDKIAGKGLSTNDYTNTEKTKLTGIAEGAEVNVNADWNATSGDAQILNKPTIPSISGLATTTYVDTQDATKQATLVSGTNIKTINGSSILGSGNMVVTTTSNPSVIAVSVPDGTPITGGTLTISTSLLVPANTIATNSIIQISWGIQRVSGVAGTVQNQIYINTSNTLTGAILVATGGNLSTAQTYFNQARDIQKVGLVAKTASTAQLVTDGTASTSINTFTLNNSVPLYFLFACSGGVGDVSVIRQVRITQYI
jgi:hypothetical protein